MSTNWAKEYPNLRPFLQHGFRPTAKASGDNIQGDCPFCGKPKHFYVNHERKTWDCKRCGDKSGGFQKFLNAVQELCADSITMERLQDLSRDRGLTPATFEHFGVGVNPATGNITLPQWDAPHERVWDLRIYRDGKFMSTAGCQVALFNWDDPALPSARTVHLCEGEWDGMAMWEILKRKGKQDEVVVAVPGVGTFKTEWVPLLEGKDILVYFDNDESGRKGSIKAYNALRNSVRSLQFVHWPIDTPDGYDVRDVYVKKFKRNPSAALEYLHDLLGEDVPQAASSTARDREETPRRIASSAAETAPAPKLDGPGMSPEQVYAAYRKWLHLPDHEVLDFMYGILLANRLPGDPLWGLMVGPSGATKTELLVTLDEAPLIAMASTWSPNALVSGANFSGAGDPSLIPKWNGKVVIIDDFTVLLNMNVVHRDEIFGILRGAYRGEIIKPFGNGITRHYKSKFGILSGVTPVIEVFAENDTEMGARFIRFPIEAPTTVEEEFAVALRASQNNKQDEQMRRDLKDTAVAVLSRDYNWDVEVPQPIVEKIIYLAMIVARLRASVRRDNYTREITHAPYKELCTRLTKQFQKLLHGVTLFQEKKVADEVGLRIIKRIAIGTVPAKYGDVLKFFWKRDAGGRFTKSQVMKLLHLPDGTVHRALESMVAVGALTRHEVSGFGAKAEWSLSPTMRGLIDKSTIFEDTSKGSGIARKRAAKRRAKD